MKKNGVVVDINRTMNFLKTGICFERACVKFPKIKIVITRIRNVKKLLRVIL